MGAQWKDKGWASIMSGEDKKDREGSLGYTVTPSLIQEKT